jgi:hypothetical protein
LRVYSLAWASDARRVTFTEYFDGWRLTVASISPVFELDDPDDA